MFENLFKYTHSPHSSSQRIGCRHSRPAPGTPSPSLSARSCSTCPGPATRCRHLLDHDQHSHSMGLDPPGLDPMGLDPPGLDPTDLDPKELPRSRRHPRRPRRWARRPKDQASRSRRNCEAVPLRWSRRRLGWGRFSSSWGSCGPRTCSR